MSTLILEGFDVYGTGTPSSANLLDGPWAEVVSPPAKCGAPPWGTPATGIGCLICLPEQADFKAYAARRVLPSAHTAIVYGLRYAVDNLPTGNYDNWVIDWRDNANAVICSLGVTSTGALELRDASNNTLAASQGPLITTQNWQFLEMELDTAAGTFVLRVNDATGAGTPAINATGLSLGSASIAQFSLAPQFNTHGRDGGTTICYYDDLSVRSTAGSVNNGFVGDLKIIALFPAADTTTAGWTPRYRLNIGTGILDNTATDALITIPSTTVTNLGAGDWTLEGFVRFGALPTGTNKATIWGKWNEAGNARSYHAYLAGPSLNSGNFCFETATDGTAGTVVTRIQYPWEPQVDVWYHLAIVRTSGELLLFVNGQPLGLPIADSATYFAGTELTCFGGQFDTGVVNTSWFTGWLDETRCTVGTARYTAPFTPPVAPLPRGSGADPHWAQVGWLCGFDTGLFDEGPNALTLTAQNGSAWETPDDGPLVGVFSTINKTTPADDTFIEADLVNAGSILTMSVLPTATNTVTVGTKDGTTAAVYTFKAAVTTAYDVKIGADVPTTLANFFNAINAGPGAGTTYGTGTVANANVSASQLPGDQMAVTALIPGTAGNAIACSDTLAHAGDGWASTTLTGGADIPGPSEFTLQRPPTNTTVISAIATVSRAFKTDSGSSTFKASFVGPHGGSEDGSAHSLTVSPTYYQDIFETDPDTMGAISPTTVVGGRIRLTRTL